MALIKCPECGRDISSHARNCPMCGYPLPLYIANEEDFSFIKDELDIYDRENKIADVIVLDGITNIKRGYLSQHTSLRSITIPKSVVTIEKETFEGCTNLTNVISNDVMAASIVKEYKNKPFSLFINFGSEIGDNLFENCNNIKNLRIGNNIKSVGFSSFFKCDSLESVSFGNNVEIIDGDAFYGCKKLTEITIPASVKKVGGFSDCVNLEQVLFEEGSTLNEIDEYAFSDCSISSIVLPNSVTIIGEGAFESCEKLMTINMPDNLKTIGDHAFRWCRKLTNITIPNSVEKIGKEAFTECINLTEIRIPSSVNFIGESAFSKCYNLADMSVDENNSVYDSRDNCNAIIETKSNTLIFGCGKTTIPNSVKKIGNYAFLGINCGKIIVIPDSVESIGNGAFAMYTELKWLKIGNGVKSFGQLWLGLDEYTLTILTNNPYVIEYCKKYNIPYKE